MDLTLTGGQAVTMSSLELVAFINEDRKALADSAGVEFPSKGYAELQHKHFLAKVPDVLGVERSANFSSDLPDSYGRLQPGYKFPKREACLMAMSYSYDLQAKVFDRMTALEEKAVKFDPASLTRLDILKMALDSEERAVKAEAQVITLETVVRDQTPKVEALDRIATSDGLLCITDAAKSLQVQPKRLFGWMQQHQWIYRRAGGSGFVGYQNRIQVGYLSHKVVTIDRSDGLTATKEQVLVTPKGLTKLAESIDLH